MKQCGDYETGCIISRRDSKDDIHNSERTVSVSQRRMEIISAISLRPFYVMPVVGGLQWSRGEPKSDAQKIQQLNP